MATTQHSNNKGNNAAGGNDRRMAFRPVEFDANNIEPDAAEGQYEVVIDDVVAGASKKEGFPQLKLSVKLEEAADKDDEKAVKSENATISDYWTFHPDRRGNMTKRKMAACAEAVDVDLDQLPKSIQSMEDLKEFVHAFKGKRLTAWVTNKEDDNGEMRAEVHYKQPRSMGGGLAPIDEIEEEAPRGRAAKTPAKGASKRR